MVFVMLSFFGNRRTHFNYFFKHLELKDAVTAFEWEPNGNRFAVLTNETARPDVQFYQLKGKSLQHLSKCIFVHVCELAWVRV